MTKYLLCKDTTADYERVWLSTDEEVEINDVIVYMDYDTPAVAIVQKFIDELEAITSEMRFLPAIKVVSMKEYNEKKAKEIQRAKLQKLMKEQMELQKLEDTFKKNSECNPAMAELFAKYKALSE